MPYSPTQIYGPIYLTTNSPATTSDATFPGVTQASFSAGGTYLSSAASKELYSLTPDIDYTTAGITADFTARLYLNNSFASDNKNLISGFVPDFYIDVFKNLNSTFSSATNSITLSSGVSQPTRDKYEVITIDYSTTNFLTNLSGASAPGISGLTYSISIVSGGTTVTAKQIYYRKLGRFGRT